MNSSMVLFSSGVVASMFQAFAVSDHHGWQCVLGWVCAALGNLGALITELSKRERDERSLSNGIRQ